MKNLTILYNVYENIKKNDKWCIVNKKNVLESIHPIFLKYKNLGIKDKCIYFSDNICIYHDKEFFKFLNSYKSVFYVLLQDYLYNKTISHNLEKKYYKISTFSNNIELYYTFIIHKFTYEHNYNKISKNDFDKYCMKFPKILFEKLGIECFIDIKYSKYNIYKIIIPISKVNMNKIIILNKLFDIL